MTAIPTTAAPLSVFSVAATSVGYLSLLFAIAWYGDRRANAGRGFIGRPSIYALSLAIYCTTWTYYGSVARAGQSGMGFLTIYLGPTLTMTLGGTVLRKMLTIAKRQRSTSIADFMAARYGKSQLLGGLVSAVAVIGITPYIALQLKAVAVSFDVLTGGDPTGLSPGRPAPLADSGLYVALTMALFAILFGTRQIDATRRHEGIVAAVAVESLVKLVAFLIAGATVIWGLFGGMGDLFRRGLAVPDIAALFTATPALDGYGWVTTLLVSMGAVVCLPRQFQIMVIENVDERHLNRALWLFPLYLWLINLFVLPVAVAGLLWWPDGGVNPDMVLLLLPLHAGLNGLALLVYLGGLSAAAGMIVVETVALSTMVCNDLVMPLLLHWNRVEAGRNRNLSGLVMATRRGAIILILLLGYGYFRVASGAYALVAIGLISFAAVAQFAPALVGGLYWAGGTRRGAIAGLLVGVSAWTYTLLLPSFARSGWLPNGFITDGPGQIALLKPYALFGLTGLDPLTHALFWSLVGNILVFVLVSVFDRPGIVERAQATTFVEPFLPVGVRDLRPPGPGTATLDELFRLTARFMGPARAEQAFARFADARQHRRHPWQRASAPLIRDVEHLLAGAIGAASARVALASAVKGGEVSMTELLHMLDETTAVIAYSQRLERKSAELEQATAALRAANQRLQELDRLKDDFLSTVTHELRTPLTAIRSLSEVLYDHGDLEAAQRQEFLRLIIKESERLTRLINEVLDMAKIEAGEIEWHVAPVDLVLLMTEAAEATRPLFRDRQVSLELAIPAAVPPVAGDWDRLTQVAVNLLSNAAKFTPAGGLVRVAVAVERGLDGGDGVVVTVADTGPGIAARDREVIFDKFHQVTSNSLTDKPQGTGLGLAICRRILDHLHGRIWVDTTATPPGSAPSGATFRFFLPFSAGPPG
ncbi:MAG: sensor histidine kinase [Azospirillaceae bacterium]|nr:sensor histidine kinase [Azospirillaceae bacterium]